MTDYRITEAQLDRLLALAIDDDAQDILEAVKQDPISGSHANRFEMPYPEHRGH